MHDGIRLLLRGHMKSNSLDVESIQSDIRDLSREKYALNLFNQGLIINYIIATEAT